jgi:hypothetical protein
MTGDRTSRTAQQWGGLVLGLIIASLGTWSLVASSQLFPGIVLVVGGIAIVLGQAIWMMRSR